MDLYQYGLLIWLNATSTYIYLFPKKDIDLSLCYGQNSKSLMLLLHVHPEMDNRHLRIANVALRLEDLKV